MRQALISDIHGNLEALNAVLADISSQSIEEIICLGDVVGYGPNPIECLEPGMKKANLTILGNHDQSTVFDHKRFKSIPMREYLWTPRV